MPVDPTIPHTDITYRIIGCAMRVHNRMGPGLKEVHYQRALTAEMRKDGLLVYEEYPVEIWDGDVYIGWVSLVIASGFCEAAQRPTCELGTPALA